MGLNTFLDFRGSPLRINETTSSHLMCQAQLNCAEVLRLGVRDDASKPILAGASVFGGGGMLGRTGFMGKV